MARSIRPASQNSSSPVSENIQQLKQSLRRDLRARLHAMTPSERAEGSSRLCSLLRGQRRFCEAGSILFFAPLPDEPDVWPLLVEMLAQHHAVALPRYDAASQHYTACQVRDLAHDLAPGEFGIREPAAHCPVVALNRLDFVLVPGLGFASDGVRLGRGKGFYDRLLAQVPGYKCGVGFDCQVGIDLPREPHDVRLNCILSPSRWHEVAGQRADVK